MGTDKSEILNRKSEIIFIDSDNCMGDGGRNPDDGFALAALLVSGAPVAAISSIFGNTSEAAAARNNRAIASLCGFAGPFLRGAAGPGQVSQASRFLGRSSVPLRIAALGPLANIAAAIAEERRTEKWCSELVMVGGMTASPDFNRDTDPEAAGVVFNSSIPLIMIPIDILDRLWCSQARLEQLRGPVGEYIRRNSQPWVQSHSPFRLGDLIAAMYLLDDAPFEIEPMAEKRVIRNFDGDALWASFAQLINGGR